VAKNNEKFVSRENAKTLWGYMVDLLTGKYTKPSGGIPKSDLASAVQTSLGKADTALQSFTETDPTVPSWAKQTNKPSYNSDEISDTNRIHKFATQTQLNQISTNQTNISSVEDMVCATEFSSSTAYAVGDMVTYEHKLYKFINAHQGAWSASDVQNYDLARMVNDLQKKAVKVYTYHVNPNESDPEDAVTYLDDATGLTPAKMGASSFSYGSWANAWFLPRPCVL
jgi:hypothetical protein